MYWSNWLSSLDSSVSGLPPFTMIQTCVVGWSKLMSEPQETVSKLTGRSKPELAVKSSNYDHAQTDHVRDRMLGQNPAPWTSASLPVTDLGAPGLSGRSRWRFQSLVCEHRDDCSHHEPPLKHHDHSRSFYVRLTRHFPDWGRVKERLDQQAELFLRR